MAEHTPGPWHVYEPPNLAHGETYGVDSASGTSVVWYGSDESEGIRKLADAQLIAAAPDFEEAAAYFVMLSKRLGAVLPEDVENWSRAVLWGKDRPGIDVIRAAIAKSFGR